jgi:hypothetical protein
MRVSFTRKISYINACRIISCYIVIRMSLCDTGRFQRVTEFAERRKGDDEVITKALDSVLSGVELCTQKGGCRFEQ